MTSKKIIKELDEQIVEIRHQKKNNKKVFNSGTLKEYLAVPEDERTIFHWLWGRRPVIPCAMAIDDFDFTDKLNEKSQGWSGFNYWFSKNYPIQYFFYEGWKNIFPYYFFVRLKSKMEDKLYRIKCFFNPRHKTLRNSIPKIWTDLDYCIRAFLFACVVSYCEEEDGLKRAKFSARMTKYREDVQFYNSLKKYYNYVKMKRAKLEKQLNKELNVASKNCEKNPNAPYKTLYGQYDKLKSLISQKDTELMEWVVKNREYLWT